MKARGPKPTVWYDGTTYACRQYDVDIPDLTLMSRIEALIWLNQNTSKRGHSSKSPQVNLPQLGLVVR